MRPMERREQIRTDAELGVTIADDELRWSGHTVNVSRAGALLATEALIGVGQVVHVGLDRGGAARAVVVREDEAVTDDGWRARRVAVRFGGPLPEAWRSVLDDVELFQAAPVEEVDPVEAAFFAQA